MQCIDFSYSMKIHTTPNYRLHEFCYCYVAAHMNEPHIIVANALESFNIINSVRES